MSGLIVARLTRRPEFLAVAASQIKSIKPHVIVQFLRRPQNSFVPAEQVRAGFTATGKLGGAVIRNRVKRRLRAAAQQLLPEYGLAGCDYVFIGRSQTHTGSFDDLIRDMKHALKRLAENSNT